MRRQANPVIDVTGGLSTAYDPARIEDKYSPSLQVVRWHKGRLHKAFGSLSFANQLGEVPMHMYTYRQIDGDRYFVCTTVDKAYYYNVSTNQWTFITSSDVFTGDEDDLFCMTTCEDTLIVTNGKDAIQKWDGSSWAALGGLSSPSIQAKFVVPFYNCLFLLNTIEIGTSTPFRVRWSDVGDMEEYDESTTLAGYFDIMDTQDHVVAGIVLGDSLYVLKENSIWEIYYTGGTDMFKYRSVIQGVGTQSPHSLHSFGETCGFYGTDNVYEFDGSTAEPIGDHIYNLLYQTEDRITNQGKLNRVRGSYDYHNRLYRLAVPTTTDRPDTEFIYDREVGSWSRRSRQVQCYGFNEATSPTLWSAATGTWTGGSWDSSWLKRGLPEDTPTLVFGSYDQYTYEEDRVELSTELLVWETKDFIFGQSFRLPGVDLHSKGTTIDVSYSTDGGFSWSAETTLNIPSEVYYDDAKYPLNITCEQIRFRLRTRETAFSLAWISPWYISRKRSL